MTDKTVGFVNSEVGSLDKLSMAGCASKVHTPSQLAQMSPMGKANILKYHIPFQIIFFVTPALQTVAIINFVMEFPDPLSNHKIRDSQLEIAPFSFKMIQEAWTAVTTKAGYVIMRGYFPRFNIFLHIVTETTKRRAF